MEGEIGGQPRKANTPIYHRQDSSSLDGRLSALPILIVRVGRKWAQNWQLKSLLGKG